jgi:hypothetical protein
MVLVTQIIIAEANKIISGRQENALYPTDPAVR